MTAGCSSSATGPSRTYSTLSPTAPGLKDRDAVVTIGNKDAGAEIKISIHQPFTTVFKADKTAFDVDMAGGTITVNMESNISYEVSIPSGCDWITMPTAARSKARAKSKSRGTTTSAVVFRVKENLSYKDREAVVTIANKDAGVSIAIYIHQPFATEFKVDKNEFEVPMEGGTVTVNVESNVDYDVSIPSGCSWITRVNTARSRATKSSVVMLRVSENTSGSDRRAVITISNSSAGVSTSITITQPFTTVFKADKTAFDVDMDGGTLVFDNLATADRYPGILGVNASAQGLFDFGRMKFQGTVFDDEAGHGAVDSGVSDF